MLKFLQSTGLTDIRFIVINSQQTGSDFNSLSELVKDSGIKVYQETLEEPIWKNLEGGKDDMFVYDRCGRLTYYVPYPLSALHDIPIVHTTLLSSYFDNPCGSPCPERQPRIITHPEASSDLFNTTGSSAAIQDSNATLDSTETINLIPPLNVSSEAHGNNETVIQEIALDLNISQEEFIPGPGPVIEGSGQQETDGNITREINESGFMAQQGIVGSGSGDGADTGSGSGPPIESVTVTETIVTSIPSKTTVDQPDTFVIPGVWKIWQYFVGGGGSSRENFAPNGGESSSSVAAGKKAESLSVSGAVTGSNSSAVGEKRCNGLDKSVCEDISVGKLLRARLCCLNEIGGHGGGGIGPGKGFRCAGYTKSICNKMLPLIKCCLKDFHQILGKYLNPSTPPNHVG